jgi:tricorn protease-like protein
MKYPLKAVSQTTDIHSYFRTRYGFGPDGANNIVMCWTPDGKNIIYRSRKQSFNDFKGQLFKVSVDGGMSTVLPLSEGGFAAFQPTGRS